MDVFIGMGLAILFMLPAIIATFRSNRNSIDIMALDRCLQATLKQQQALMEFQDALDKRSEALDRQAEALDRAGRRIKEAVFAQKLD
jgi:hypothetical protein